ncbi:capsular polysaccharide biosynthesis protein [Geodermatophilus tzadiensis]|uniref:Capsular polysaccharide biosynthesis protein n=1 Tax=Geodermatophilus tzadiensis TaxID=1137988 RepID=A0A2T0TUZ6_9ACTN|nr:hypothetical protein [Geodermatophilus tzadiensis]PRY49348.1 capsular polysaccharide biosynthesis protein [Geodermatophilus tzadiensis]
MTLTAYAAAVVRRWPWVVLAGLVGALLGPGLAPAATYEAGTELYVGVARVDDREDAVYAALLREEVLPTLAELARSAPDGAGAEGTTVRAELVEDTSVLRVSVGAATPQLAAARADAVADAVRDRARTTYRDADGAPLLTVATVAPATPPRVPASRDGTTLAALGTAGGAALAALGAGLLEGARPRVHTAAQVPGAPVLAAPGGRGRRRAARRAVRVDRLRTLLGSGAGGRPVALVGSSPHRAGLTRELAAGGVLDVVDGPGRSPGGVVVVAEAGRTTVRQLDADLAAVRDGGAAVRGVVVDGHARGGRLAALLDRVEPRAAVRPWTSPTGWCALLALAVAGADLSLPLAATSGLVVTALLLPLWGPALRRYRGGVPLAVLTGLGLLSGLLLARWSAVDHAVAPLEAAATGFAVLTGLGTVGLLLWARTVLPLRAVGVAFGVGQLVHGLLRVPVSDNPVKFELSFPLTVVLLSLVVGRRRPGASLAVLGGMGLLNVLNDARSAFALCLAAAAAVVWQARPGVAGRAVRWGRGAVLLLVGGTAAYALLSELLVSGALGAGLQARSAAQVAQSGSLLVGGRPEWTATWSLVQSRPLGFGLGTVPSPGDVQLGASGIAAVNDPTAEGYLQHYLLDGRFELHSVVADLWSNLGPLGLLLGLTMAGLLVAALAVRLARREAPALLCFLVPTALWFLAFGPLPTDLDAVTLAVGLALLPRAAAAPPVAQPPAVAEPGPVRGRVPVGTPAG